MRKSTIQAHLGGVMEEHRASETGMMEINRSIESAITGARALLLCAQRANDKTMLAAARRNLRRVEAFKRSISVPELWSDLAEIQSTARALYSQAEAAE